MFFKEFSWLFEIAALDENFAIGRKGQLPWHLPDDLRWSGQLTTGKNVLMGCQHGHPLAARCRIEPTWYCRVPPRGTVSGQITVRSMKRCRRAPAKYMVIDGATGVFRRLPRARRMY